MSQFSDVIAGVIDRLIRDDFEAKNVVGAESATFARIRQVAQLSSAAEAVLNDVARSIAEGDASGVLITLADGRQLRVTVEEV